MVWSEYDQGTGRQQIYSSLQGQLTFDPEDHENPSVNNLGDVVWSQPVGTENVCDEFYNCWDESVYGVVGLIGGRPRYRWATLWAGHPCPPRRSRSHRRGS